jgi:branched-chain amino acid transport system substrate-binding protein
MQDLILVSELEAHMAQAPTVRPSIRFVSVAALAISLAAAAGCGSSSSSGNGASSSSAPGVTASSIKIGVLIDETGAGAGPYGAGILMALQARVSWQNAHGGVYGRKIDLDIKDTGSSDSQTLAAAQTLVQQDNVFAIWAEPNFFASAERYLNSAHIPVVGVPDTASAVWATPSYTNLFPFQGPTNPQAPVPAGIGTFLKSKGVTNLGVVAFNISGSEASGEAIALSAKDAGVKVGYINTDAQLGQTSYTTDGIALKNAGVDAFYGALDPQGDVNAVVSIKDAGGKLKVVLLPAGYGDEDGILASPAKSDAQGFYFDDSMTPDTISNPGTDQEREALAKYGKFTGLNGFDTGAGYISGDVLITGLKVAGKNPTRESFMTNLRAVKDYTGNGLLPKPINFSTPASKGGLSGLNYTGCIYFLQAVGTQYKVVTPHPICDAYTSQVALP